MPASARQEPRRMNAPLPLPALDAIRALLAP